MVQSANFTIKIIDDIPVAQADNGGTTTEDSGNPLGNVLNNDKWGADGAFQDTKSVVSAEYYNTDL